MVNKSACSTPGESSSGKERNSDSMSNPMEKVTDNIGEKFKYKCNRCDKLFQTPTFKQDHIQVVHLGIRFNCLDSSCKKSFVSQNVLTTHLKPHNEIPTKMCHVCSKSFVYQSQLEQHLYTHENVQNFVCSKCNKNLRKYELNRYLKSCGQKVECAECGKVFVEK